MFDADVMDSSLCVCSCWIGSFLRGFVNDTNVCVGAVNEVC